MRSSAWCISPIGARGRSTPTSTARVTPSTERPASVDDGMASRPEHPELAVARVELEPRAQEVLPGWAPNLDGCGASADWGAGCRGRFAGNDTCVRGAG